ncbi:PA0069 family radical SAM protein [Mariprofundus erugo]|uniref:PA0069 family radical SAM protein n=1 Tax=Mariprofundus erugo TaxID=2528639 RepID=A0A5R9GQM2_9PROT|nr:PA0069 family radical SAM protein [Mariprofundus erugo]TLS67229.1 PA0069 family radical SAM protein [Mariprofundus erugo]
MKKRPFTGRGTLANPVGRFAGEQRETFDDGWWQEEEPAPLTRLLIDSARTIINYNDSPDLPFDRSINPYRGCEHGCPYCFARPTHSYLDLSPGLDFESVILHKPGGPELLRRELSRPNYRVAPVALGINTDGWQPLEKRLQLTRRLLAVLAEFNHPVSIVTKSALIVRDLDLLAPMAAKGLVSVAISLSTLEGELARRMEPRAATPARRLQTMQKLAGAGVPVGVLVAPVIPHLNDHEVEKVLQAACEHGASWGAHVLLRLPHELKELFPAWLEENYPARAAAVLRQLREMRGGELYESAFGTRMGGQGIMAQLLARRVRAACTRLGMDDGEQWRLRSDLFRVPGRGEQQQLF